MQEIALPAILHWIWHQGLETFGTVALHPDSQSQEIVFAPQFPEVRDRRRKLRITSGFPGSRLQLGICVCREAAPVVADSLLALQVNDFEFHGMSVKHLPNSSGENRPSLCLHR